jgi:hypothetical protein
MSIPGIAATDRSPLRAAPGAGVGMAMPGIAAEGCSDGTLPAGSDCGVCGADISIPGIACGAGAPDGGAAGAGAAISIPGIEDGAGWAGDGVRMVIPGMESALAGFGAGALAALRRLALRAGPVRFLAALVWGRAFGLAAGLAGIFIPGIGMPPIFWAAAMPGSIATAAAATSHLVLIIEKSPWNK